MACNFCEAKPIKNALNNPTALPTKQSPAASFSCRAASTEHCCAALRALIQGPHKKKEMKQQHTQQCRVLCSYDTTEQPNLQRLHGKTAHTAAEAAALACDPKQRPTAKLRSCNAATEGTSAAAASH
jgi:hypothetical protein